jgi:hypothetical protein
LDRHTNLIATIAGTFSFIFLNTILHLPINILVYNNFIAFVYLGPVSRGDLTEAVQSKTAHILLS